MQSVHTRATNVYEVQKVKTFANLLETLGGSFTLGFDTTATGGGAYITAQISNAALAPRGMWGPGGGLRVGVWQRRAAGRVLS